MMTLQQACNWVAAGKLPVLLVGDGHTRINRVHTDTRTLQGGDLFVALKGEHFDAHDFLAQARASGAAAAIAHYGLGVAGLPGLEVSDSKLALGQLASSWRSQFDLPLIAVTGSNGKTTVTQMIASILRAWKPGAAFATEGNFNNDIGVPLTLLRLRPAHQAGVVELGMNHPGEIACLAKLTRPAIALVNNAQREHLEFMDTVQAVALENGSVIDSLDAQGVAVFPADDAYTAMWQTMAGVRKVLTFALEGPADVTAVTHWAGSRWEVRAATPSGPTEFTLGIAGRHNVKNALAAMACALAAGVPLADIAAGLKAFVPVKGRSRAVQVRVSGRLIHMIDDTYNANPDSMRAAIDMLAELPGPRLLVMGDMAEVGSQGPQFHEEAGRLARNCGIEQLFALGTQSARAASSFGQGQHFTDMATLNAAVLAALSQFSSMLVKGSRSMQMERVVQAVSAAPTTFPESSHAA